MTIETQFSSTQTWRKIGTAPDRPATAAETIQAAGLDWGVALVPVYAEGQPIPRSRAVVRTDRKSPIAVVGNRYVPVQNTEAFAFFDDLVGAGKAVYETAGALDRGRRVWLQARLPEDVWVTEEDNVGKYLLLSNSHDGGSSLRALFTPIRVVCKNTLLAALGEAGSSGISIRHVGDVLGRAKEAERLLGISLKYFDDFADASRTLARKTLTREALELYFADLVPAPLDGDPTRAIATRETLKRLFEVGKGNSMPGVRGTLWAALNAVVEFVDHERPIRRREDDTVQSKRFESALFGSGAQLKGRAWSQALALVG